MAKKEPVEIIRNDEYDAVIDDLSRAMESLDEANQRILDLLSSETITFQPEGAAELEDEAGEMPVPPPGAASEG